MGLYKSLDDLLNDLDMQNAPKIWNDDWEPSMDLYDMDSMEYLTDEYIMEANHLLHLNDDIMRSCFTALAIIRKSPALCQLAWLWHYIVFSSGRALESLAVSTWPTPSVAMRSSADMLHAVVLVSGIPRLHEYYEKKKLPQSVFLDTLSDLGMCMEEYKAAYGIYGVGVFRMGWLLYGFTGLLFKIGRLQFICRPYDGTCKIFRHVNDGRIVAICDHGLKFEGNTLVNDTKDIPAVQGIWETCYVECDDSIEGNPVSSVGYPNRERIKLLKKEWEAVLSQGDFVLDTHIQSGCKMDYDLCRSSYGMALEFYSKYFPDVNVNGFVCSSWLLNPSLRAMLPEWSNIVKFQRDYDLVPMSGDDSVFEYVFGGKSDDLSKLKGQTSLQRSIRTYLSEGNAFASAGGFILKEDIQEKSSGNMSDIYTRYV